MEKTYRLKTNKMLKLLTGYILVAVLTFACKASAQPSLIMDDETQTLLSNIISPLFKAADIPFNKNKIYIVNDNSLNAFVSGGNYMFVHTGTLINADNVNELSGILAHETGHIAGGHIARQKLRIEQLQTLSVASLIVAGATAAASGRGDAALAVMLGSQSSLLNAMTAYQLQEERSADESAVKYLSATGQSPHGLKNFMKKIQIHNRLSGYEEIPYFRTHPLSLEREEFFNQALKNNSNPSTSVFDKDFKLVKAKLSAFLLPVEQAKKKYPKTDKSVAGMYANSIIAYKENNFSKADALLNELIKKEPSNPYFYELKGQFLFESGNIKEAVKAYEQALKIKPDANDIILSWAQAKLEDNHTDKQLQKIITQLNKTVIKSPSATAWLLLARAYDENKQKAYALYSSAQYSLAIGNIKIAKKQIEDALKTAPQSLKLKLNDLKNLIKQKEENGN